MEIEEFVLYIQFRELENARSLAYKSIKDFNLQTLDDIVSRLDTDDEICILTELLVDAYKFNNINPQPQDTVKDKPLFETLYGPIHSGNIQRIIHYLAIKNKSGRKDSDKYKKQEISKIQNLQAENERIKKRNRQLEQWYQSWQDLKHQITSDLYTPSEIEEAGALMDDPTVMLDSVKGIMESFQVEQNLQEENARLKAEQDAWRERPEYKEEIEKYKKQSAQKIPVDTIKQGLERLSTEFQHKSNLNLFIYRLNYILRGTAWDSVPNEFFEDIKELFDNSQQPKGSNVTVNGDVHVTGDLIENGGKKNVNH